MICWTDDGVDDLRSFGENFKIIKNFRQSFLTFVY